MVELVGIINLTPDSFSGNSFTDPEAALANAAVQIRHGASYLDIGAESTRPGATPISAEEEWRRLEPVISKLIPTRPGRISIDSYHPETIRRAASEIGSFIINDVTAFNNPEMIALAAQLNKACIVSHLPQSMGQDIQAAHKSDKKVDSVTQVHDELMERREQLIKAGVKPEMIILDPGIGFGKTKQTSLDLIGFAALVPSIPVMIGYSKKSCLGEDRLTLERNLEAGRIAVASGAKYLRIHDDLIAGHREEFN